MLTRVQKPFSKIQQTGEAFSVRRRMPMKVHKGGSSPRCDKGRMPTVMTSVQRHPGASSQCSKGREIRNKGQKGRSRLCLLTDIAIFHRETPKQTTKQPLELGSELREMAEQDQHAQLKCYMPAATVQRLEKVKLI